MSRSASDIRQGIIVMVLILTQSKLSRNWYCCYIISEQIPISPHFIFFLSDQNGSTTTSSPTDSPDEKSDTPLEESESPAAVDAEGDAAAAPETSSDDAGVHSDSNDSEDTAANGEHTEL